MKCAPFFKTKKRGFRFKNHIVSNGLDLFVASESITLFWSPWGSKDSGCSKIKIAKVKACCYSTFTLAIYCFMDFATNVKKKEKAPHTAEIAVKYSHYKILRRSLFL